MTRSFKLATAVLLAAILPGLIFGQKPRLDKEPGYGYTIQQIVPPQSPLYAHVPPPQGYTGGNGLGDATEAFWEASIRYKIYASRVKALRNCDPKVAFRTGACVIDEVTEYERYDKVYIQLSKTWGELLVARNTLVASLNNDSVSSPEVKDAWLKYTEDLDNLLNEKYGAEIQNEHRFLMRTKPK